MRRIPRTLQVIILTATLLLTFALTGCQTTKYTVNFELNYDDAGLHTSVSVKKDAAVARPDPNPTRTGHDFDGWYDNADGTDGEYDFATPVTGDLTLYAQWKALIYDVTLKLNYQGAGDDVVLKVAYGRTVQTEQPTRDDGYVFMAWYTDAACTQVFDTSAPITGAVTLYAGWQAVAADQHSVTFYYIDPTEDAQNFLSRAIVQSGDLVGRPETPTTPNVTGAFMLSAVFVGWFTDAAGKTAFDFTAPVTADENVYGIFHIEYRFEAEHVDLAGKEGAIYSSTVKDEQLIVIDTYGTDGREQNASNGFSVSYMFIPWVFIEFRIWADEAVDDAVFSARLTAMYRNIYMAPRDTMIGSTFYASFTFAVNEEPTDIRTAIRDGETLPGMLDYAPIALTGAVPELTYPLRAFSDHTISANVSLQEGWNSIVLMTTNTEEYESTIIASAPQIDCIGITTGTRLTWNPKIDNEDKAENLE